VTSFYKKAHRSSVYPKSCAHAAIYSANKDRTRRCKPYVNYIPYFPIFVNQRVLYDRFPNAPFPRGDELKTKSARLDELNILLNLDKKENEIVDGDRADDDEDRPKPDRGAR
jgi:hypothetical protein